MSNPYHVVVIRQSSSKRGAFIRQDGEGNKEGDGDNSNYGDGDDGNDGDGDNQRRRQRQQH